MRSKIVKTFSDLPMSGFVRKTVNRVLFPNGKFDLTSAIRLGGGLSISGAGWITSILYNQSKDLLKLSEDITHWHTYIDENIFGTSKHLIFLSPKLRLMSDATEEEIEYFQSLHKCINKYALDGNEFQRKLRNFNMLIMFGKTINYFGASFNWDKIIDSSQTTIEHKQEQLVSLSYLNFFHECTIRKEFGIANYYITKLIDRLGIILKPQEIPYTINTKTSELSTLLSSTQSYLIMSLLNYSAKSERAIGNFAKCERYYDYALTIDNKNPILIQSKLALHGDYAWVLNKIDKISYLLEDSEINKLAEFFTTAKHGLGLADLSWACIQLVWHSKELNLSLGKKQKIILSAIQFANDSIPLIDKSSVNGYLFKGIACMEYYNLENDSSILQEAKNAIFEGLQLDPNHPSLLRRNFMISKALGHDDAHENLLLALAEISFRLRYEDLYADTVKQYSKWQSDLVDEARLIIQSSEELAIIDQLQNGNFNVLKNPNLLSTRIQLWYQSHFNEEGWPKNRHKLLKLMNLSECVTPRVCAWLSRVTYDANYPGIYVAADHWEPKINSKMVNPNWNKESGYLGVAFQNSVTGQWIISHGGTDLNDYEDLKTDAMIGLGNSNLLQLEHAKNFTDKVLDLIISKQNELKALNLPLQPSDYIVFHTGHSLGGFIAAYLASTTFGKINHRAISFDCPSAQRQILKHSEIKNMDQLPVTTYLTRPSFINCASGKHPGCSYHITLDLPDDDTISPVAAKLWAEVSDEVLGKLNVPDTLKNLITKAPNAINLFTKGTRAHNQKEIFSVFDDNSALVYSKPLSIWYVVKWPHDLRGWLNFEAILKDFAIDNQSISLTGLPKEVLLKLDNADLYASRASFVIEKDNSLTEIIELKNIESILRLFIMGLFEPAQLNDGELKTYQKLLGYVNLDLFRNVIYDPDAQCIKISRPLSGWELMTYLRQQLSFASNSSELNVAVNYTSQPTISTSGHNFFSYKTEKQFEDNSLLEIAQERDGYSVKSKS